MNHRSEWEGAEWRRGRGLRLHGHASSALSAAVGLALLSIASPALAAPTAHECAAASEDALTLQKQEKLLAAKDRFLVCTDVACPAEIREECGHRLSEVTDATPSVVFDVKDASGNDVSAVRVMMDGALLLDHVGPSAIAIDPGEHIFHFDGADPAQSLEKNFVVRDGEKNRHLAIVLGGGAAVAAPAHEQSKLGGQKMAALVTGGVGLVALAVGSIFGAKTITQWNEAKTECGASCPPGSATQTAAQGDKNTATTFATISDVGFIAAGVLVAGAATLWLTAPSQAAIQVTPAASPQGAGLLLRGTF
jgi:hypothetical protein